MNIEMYVYDNNKVLKKQYTNYNWIIANLLYRFINVLLYNNYKITWEYDLTNGEEITIKFKDKLNKCIIVYSNVNKFYICDKLANLKDN